MCKAYNPVFKRNVFLECINDIRFRRFEYEQIEESYSAELTHYYGCARRVTVPAYLNGYYISELGPKLFNNNPRIRSVRVSEGVSMICEEAFEDCARLEKLILPASVTDIQGQPFAGCRKLREIIIDPNNPSLYMHNGLLIERKYGRLVFCLNRTDETINVPNGVKIITEFTFMYCKKMHSIRLPDSIEKIEPCAFLWSGLREFPIPRL